MKTFLNSLKFLVILLIGSCSTEEYKVKTGQIQFNFDNQTNGRQGSSSETTAVLISISKANGTVVYEMLKLDLLSFGSGFVTKSIELSIGEYKLTSFLVLDSENTIRYACPLEGSEQSAFVDDPLPIYFHVSENGITTVVPQVLEVTPDDHPAGFGYVNFGFEIVTPWDSLQVQSLQFILDGKPWKAAEVDSAVFNTDDNWLGIMGRTYLNDTTYEHMAIFIWDYDFTTGKIPVDKIHLELGENISLSTGQGDFKTSSWGTPIHASITITEYNFERGTISGTFFGYLYDLAGLNKKVIRHGIFNEISLMKRTRP